MVEADLWMVEGSGGLYTSREMRCRICANVSLVVLPPLPVAARPARRISASRNKALMILLL